MLNIFLNLIVKVVFGKYDSMKSQFNGQLLIVQKDILSG